MRKVKLFETGEIVEVGNNEAFGLVDADKATYDLDMFVPKRKITGKGAEAVAEQPIQAPKNKKEAEKQQKEREMTRQFYKDRQLRAEQRFKKQR